MDTKITIARPEWEEGRGADSMYAALDELVYDVVDPNTDFKGRTVQVTVHEDGLYATAELLEKPAPRTQPPFLPSLWPMGSQLRTIEDVNLPTINSD